MRTKVRIGIPDEEILQEARERQYGLIVIGDRLARGMDQAAAGLGGRLRGGPGTLPSPCRQGPGQPASSYPVVRQRGQDSSTHAALHLSGRASHAPQPIHRPIGRDA